MQEFFAQYLIPALILVGLAIALTLFVFRRRWFDRTGVYREGVPADAEKVRQQNRHQKRWRRGE